LAPWTVVRLSDEINANSNYKWRVNL
jgi:hypothetical protein